jgi:hypothetical protein
MYSNICLWFYFELVSEEISQTLLCVSFLFSFISASAAHFGEKTGSLCRCLMIIPLAVDIHVKFNDCNGESFHRICHFIEVEQTFIIRKTDFISLGIMWCFWVRRTTGFQKAQKLKFGCHMNHKNCVFYNRTVVLALISIHFTFLSYGELLNFNRS